MRIQPAIALGLLVACGRGDAPAFTGSWTDSADGVEITLLSDGTSLAGTGLERPNRPFRVYGNGTNLVFFYLDQTGTQSYAWSLEDDELHLQGLSRSLVFTRE